MCKRDLGSIQEELDDLYMKERTAKSDIKRQQAMSDDINPNSAVARTLKND